MICGKSIKLKREVLIVLLKNQSFRFSFVDFFAKKERKVDIKQLFCYLLFLLFAIDLSWEY